MTMGASLSRRSFLSSLAAGAGALALGEVSLGAGRAGGERTPNFVVIFTDDQGYQDVGCFGSPKIKTPHLDRMAAEGMKLTDFYSAASVCTPSRAALLTGCYPTRVSLPSVLFPRSKTGLHADEVTIAEILKAKGYATMCIGKWHLGFQKQFLPTEHGFDHYYGIPYSNDMWLAPAMAVARDAKLGDGLKAEDLEPGINKRNHVPLLRDTEIVEYPADQATLTERYTAEALRFIAANKDRPFFLYLPHTMPHVPLFASPPFKGKSARGLYGDVIEAIDWCVGQVLATLKKLGLDERTLVLFTSDNGPWLSKGANGGCALPLRGGTFPVWEGGMREPTLARWPGRIPAGSVCAEVATTLDILPTFAKLAGAKPPDDRIIDGRDIWPLLSGQQGAKSPHEAFFFFRGNGLQAVRSGKWKLHLGRTQRPRGKKKAKPQSVPAQLYDLHADISESKDVAAQHPDVVERLVKLATDMAEDIKKNRRPCGKA